MELHYFPRLGGEFFLYESDLGDISQFHAAPAADIIRLEIESMVDRSYEWVVHHLDPVREVISAGRKYAEVKQARLLRPGAWFYDKDLKNLHVTVEGAAGADVIVNVSF